MVVGGGGVMVVRLVDEARCSEPSGEVVIVWRG